MYQSLSKWIQVTFSQDDPIIAKNEITPQEIEQLMYLRRIRDPLRAILMRNNLDLRFSVDRNTAQVTLQLRDLDGAKLNYAHGWVYWFHPDNLDILIDDVVIEEHLYTFYPVTLDLQFNLVLAADDSVVDVRGHLLNARRLMEDVAKQWLLKIGMVTDIRGSEFDRLAGRFRSVINRYFGATIIRRSL
jgi:hypothetical protein